MELNFWKNKKVFITGHTGFKGTWLTIILNYLEADVFGFSLKPKNLSMFNQCNVGSLVKGFYGNINNQKQLNSAIESFSPEIVIHMAAQSLVIESYKSPKDTFKTNVFGTLNILTAIQNLSSLKVFLNVTSDKCYLNENNNIRFDELSPLGGNDPYSASKACAEIVHHSLIHSFFRSEINSGNFGASSVRAGNVIGGGDWSKDRLIPDLVKSVKNKRIVNIRFPNATRPWQHVLDCLFGYLTLVEKMYMNPRDYSSSWNIGPSKDEKNVAVSELCEYFKNNMKINYEINEKDRLYESNTLSLNTNKFEKYAKWTPKFKNQIKIEKTIEWYKAWLAKENLYNKTLNQVLEYIDD